MSFWMNEDFFLIWERPGMSLLSTERRTCAMVTNKMPPILKENTPLKMGKILRRLT